MINPTRPNSNTQPDSDANPSRACCSGQSRGTLAPLPVRILVWLTLIIISLLAIRVVDRLAMQRQQQLTASTHPLLDSGPYNHRDNHDPQ